MLYYDDLEIKPNKSLQMYCSIALFPLNYYIEQLIMAYRAIDSEYIYLDHMLIKGLYTIEEGAKLVQLRLFYRRWILFLKEYQIYFNEYMI